MSVSVSRTQRDAHTLTYAVESLSMVSRPPSIRGEDKFAHLLTVYSDAVLLYIQVGPQYSGEWNRGSVLRTPRMPNFADTAVTGSHVILMSKSRWNLLPHCP